MAQAKFEISVFRGTEGGAYQISAQFIDPDADVRRATARGQADLDLAVFEDVAADEKGAALEKALFPEGEVRKRFEDARNKVDARNDRLRIVLNIDRSASDLHLLPWETLTDPLNPGSLIATNPNLPFSRFLESDTWREIKLRRKTDLRALVAVSNHPETEKFATVGAEDFAQVKADFEALQVKVDGLGLDEPFTLDSLTDRLKAEPVDILYVVCHGEYKRGLARLALQDDSGEAKIITGEELATRIRELPITHVPRLVVFASCQSARTDSKLSPLGPMLAAAGVSSIVAMQGKINQDTAKAAMKEFFRDLISESGDGHVDRAMAAARGKVRDRNDAWMPALFSRFKTGRIWETQTKELDQNKDLELRVQVGHDLKLKGTQVGRVTGMGIRGVDADALDRPTHVSVFDKAEIEDSKILDIVGLEFRSDGDRGDKK